MRSLNSIEVMHLILPYGMSHGVQLGKKILRHHVY